MLNDVTRLSHIDDTGDVRDFLTLNHNSRLINNLYPINVNIETELY